MKGTSTSSNGLPGPRVILGSRSPRRRELLGLLIPPQAIDIRPPRTTDEQGFEGLTSWLEIAKRLQAIARDKNEDVQRQLTDELAQPESPALILTADTTIVASDALGSLSVLGQPSESADWCDEVRTWFRDLYADRSHIAATAICLTEWPSGRCEERLVQSHVWMRSHDPRLMDWYLSTGEPRGKAGGYALQGLGSVFVTRVEGSISNVVGLPLEMLVEMLPRFGWPLHLVLSAEARHAGR